MLPLPKFSIILPVYNEYQLTNRFLFDLYKQVPFLSEGEVIVVSDGSSDETIGGLNWWKSTIFKHHGFQVYYGEFNRGFGWANNIGAELAQSNIFLFISNDVLIHEDFVTKALVKLAENPRRLLGNEVYTTDVGWNKFGEYIVPYIAGYFFGCRKDIWEELGGFDPRYGKATYEDIDISLTAISKGIELTQCQFQLQHLVGQTMKMDDKRMELTKHNQEIFIQKWANKLPEIMEKYNKEKIK
jgi:Predicted glycosyltransferases